MRAFRAAFVVLVLAGAWLSPACKSNEINQTSNTTNNSFIVDENGATIEVEGGPKVRIPAGALDQRTEITISEASPDEYPPPSGWSVAGKVWEFQPHGLKFFVDATIFLPAPPGMYDAYKAEPTGAWQRAGGGESQGGFVQARTSSFSYWALQQVTVSSGGDGGSGGPDSSGYDAAGCGCPAVTMPGAPCGFCGTPFNCNGMSGGTMYSCTCDSSKMLTGCTGTSMDAGADGGACGGCPAGKARLRADAAAPCCTTSTVPTCSSGMFTTTPCAGSTEYICKTGPDSCL